MDISNKKSRADLQSYFKKNSIPTEQNFADLIGTTLNQRDDGIIKPPNDPLSIEASNQDHKPVLSLYEEFTDVNPSWVLSLAESAGNRGFGIISGTEGQDAGTMRLFIEMATGNVGIGSVAPSEKLEVNGGLKAQTATIAGAVRAGSTLDVAGTLMASSRVDVVGALNAKSTLDVTGAVAAAATLDVAGAVKAAATLDVAGAVTVASTLDVAGALTASSKVDVVGALNAKSTLDVTGAVRAASTLDVAGALTASSKVDVVGALNAKSTLDVTGALKAATTLDVIGALTAKSSVTIDGALTTQSTLDVSGAVKANATVDVAGTLTASSKLDVLGALNAESTLTVAGALTASSANISGALTSGALTPASLVLGGTSATKIVDSIAPNDDDATSIPTELAVRSHVEAAVNQAKPKTTDSVTTGDATALTTSKAVKDFVNAAIPIGAILMWSGAVIPEGWAACDGTFSAKLGYDRPDLTNSFVLGKSAGRPIGTKGGAETVTLATKQLPAHTHTATTDSAGEHTHTLGYTTDCYKYGDALYSESNLQNKSKDSKGVTSSVNTDSVGAHTHTFTIGNTGDNESHENMPPYYVLAYIIREA